MNEENITQEQITQLSQKQQELYNEALEHLLHNQNLFWQESDSFENKIYLLKKMISANKRQRNKYAVLRDEVKLKSYRLLDLQNKMVKNIFQALNHHKLNAFEVKMYAIFTQSQEEIQALTTEDYTPFLALKEENKILKEAQSNIKDFYALLEINADILRYLVDSKKRIYGLNKYENLNLLSLVLYINHTQIVSIANPYLAVVGLDSVKVILILFLIFLFYFLRTVVYFGLEKLLLEIVSLRQYTTQIMEAIGDTLRLLLLLINIEVLIFVYNDFNRFPEVSQGFNIIYTLFLTLLFYRVLNAIALIKIQNINKIETKIKSEMVNVGIKIINFMIFLLGISIILHFAGVQLSTVLSGLGIGGFAVALAARESLSNFFGTLSLLMSDVLSQGDWIESNGREGTVVEIGLRVTTLRTFDNALIAIPNGTLANEDVKNWSKRRVGRRIKMNLGVRYDSKPSNIRQAIREIRTMLTLHPDIAKENTRYTDNFSKSAKLLSREDANGVKRNLMVTLDEFGDSSIVILVYCFSRTTVWDEWLEVKEDVMYKIMDIFEENNLEFAFPSLSLYQEKEEE